MINPAEEEERPLGKLMAPLLFGFIEQGIREGEIQLDDVTEGQLRGAIIEFMRGVEDERPPWSVHLDHGSTLASEAAKHHADGKTGPAIVLYATHVEHWLNGMLLVGATRQGLSRDDCTKMLRANQVTKTGWLWRLLFKSGLPRELLAELSALTDARNAFVHYKWEGRDEHATNNQLARQREISESAPRLLADLAALEDSIVFHGKRQMVERVFQSTLPDSMRHR